jgi:outer membrane protein assembly factor BamD
MFRRLPVFLLLAVLAFSAACTNKKVKNPIANIDSKQPDKVLFDRAMDALKHNRFDVARLTLQTLINTYPDSEFLARAKLGVADSWYAEGGSAALAQAELEYSDFITFFPNMPEAAEAQLKIANIHYQQMEKPDRDFTHAMRAEQEYRKLIMQWPDSKLVPEAKQRLLEVQELLAEREYGIGRFYYLRPAYPAAIARLESLVDRYPLFSRADEALFLLGQSYESEIAMMEKQRLEEGSVPWKARQRLIDDYTNKAADAYSKILTRYPMMTWAPDAKERLEALHRPVPRPTKAAVALNKKEEDSRKESGTLTKVMGGFRKRPDVSQAAHVGDPTLADTELTSASEVVQQAARVMVGSTAGGGNNVAVETIGKGAPAPSEAPPSSFADPSKAADGATTSSAGELTPNVPADSNELKPNVSEAVDTTLPPPSQTNQIDASAPQGSAADASKSSQGEDADVTYSSSKHKKKKGLHKLIPF